MIYRLWDTEIGRLFGQFETRSEALDVVQVLIARYGADYADDLALRAADDQGNALELVSGSALVAEAARELP